MIRILNRLFLVEQIVLSFSLLACALYALVGLAPRSPLDLYQQRLVHSLVFYLVGLSLCPLALRLRSISGRRVADGRISWRTTWNQFRDMFLTRQMLWRDLRIVHAISVMFVVYINLKHLVPFLTPKMHDDFFYQAETSAFGQLLGLILQRIFSLDAAPLLATGYVAFYSFVAVLIFVMIFSQRGAVALEFAAAFVLLWFIGILMVYLVPTMGPCFYRPELFTQLPFTDVTELQVRLLQHKEHLETHINSSAVYLISGFPSLHLAVPLLGFVYLRKTSQLLGIVAILFAGITTITTLYFGWHYVFDDLGSVLLASLAIICARIMKDKLPSKDCAL